jgi:hypothetical protein
VRTPSALRTRRLFSGSPLTCVGRPSGRARRSKPDYPLLLRAVDFTVSTIPPTQGITAATELVEVGTRDDMVLSPGSVILLG